MKTLTRFEMAAVKRTAQNTKTLLRNKEKVEAKMRELATRIVEINQQIDVWETPIKQMTGGYTSSEVIALRGQIPNPKVEEENVVEQESQVEEVF